MCVAPLYALTTLAYDLINLQSDYIINYLIFYRCSGFLVFMRDTKSKTTSQHRGGIY